MLKQDIPTGQKMFKILLGFNFYLFQHVVHIFLLPTWVITRREIGHRQLGFFGIGCVVTFLFVLANYDTPHIFMDLLAVLTIALFFFALVWFFKHFGKVRSQSTLKASWPLLVALLCAVVFWYATNNGAFIMVSMGNKWLNIGYVVAIFLTLASASLIGKVQHRYSISATILFFFGAFFLYRMGAEKSVLSGVSVAIYALLALFCAARHYFQFLNRAEDDYIHSYSFGMPFAFFSHLPGNEGTAFRFYEPITIGLGFMFLSAFVSDVLPAFFFLQGLANFALQHSLWKKQREAFYDQKDLALEVEKKEELVNNGYSSNTQGVGSPFMGDTPEERKTFLAGSIDDATFPIPSAEDPDVPPVPPAEDQNMPPVPPAEEDGDV